MSRLTRDGTAEPVSRDQILRHARGQGNINFPCSADHEQDWQAYPVSPYSAICDDNTCIHTYILHGRGGKGIIMAESFSREKNEGTHRRRKVDEKSCVTLLLCDPGWYVQRT